MMTRKTFLATALCLITAPALAGGHGSKIMVEDPFSRASASPAVKVGGVYMTLKNMGDADTLVEAKGAEIASNIELHTHEVNDGVMSMVEVEGGIPVPEGETVMLKPGGFHVMLMGLKQPLVKGESLDLVLVFETAGEVPVTVPILGPAAMSADGKTGGHGHNHSHGDDHSHSHGSDS